VRIKEGDEWKTVSRTRYGQFEYNVMPFGLTNAPTIFQYMMKNIFRKYLDDFVVIYLDDILVFSKNEKELEKHVQLILKKLRKRGLYAKLENCLFHQTEMEFLGFVATTEGLKMDPKKVEAIVFWQVLKTVRDVQCFLGFANLYRIFIKKYSQVAAPLIRLTCKEKLEWGHEAERAFQDPKMTFTTTPILVHPTLQRLFIWRPVLETLLWEPCFRKLALTGSSTRLPFILANSLLLKSTIKSTIKNSCYSGFLPRVASLSQRRYTPSDQ
jgi:hypothetical protein